MDERSSEVPAATNGRDWRQQPETLPSVTGKLSQTGSECGQVAAVAPQGENGEVAFSDSNICIFFPFSFLFKPSPLPPSPVSLACVLLNLSLTKVLLLSSTSHSLYNPL